MTLPLNKVYLMDCLDGMKQIEDKSVDLVLTDPPYGIRATGTNYINGTSKSEKPYYNDDLQWDDKPITKEYFDEIIRISQNQIIFGGNYYFEFLGNTRCFLVWDKTIHGNSYADCEMAWTSFDEVARVYRMNMVETNKDGRCHPTQKPLKLMKWILEKYSDVAMTILDPFMGSGTTCVACKKLDRNYIGIEKEPAYVAIAEKRLEKVNNHKIEEWF